MRNKHYKFEVRQASLLFRVLESPGDPTFTQIGFFVLPFSHIWQLLRRDFYSCLMLVFFAMVLSHRLHSIASIARPCFKVCWFGGDFPSFLWVEPNDFREPILSVNPNFPDASYLLCQLLVVCRVEPVTTFFTLWSTRPWEMKIP